MSELEKQPSDQPAPEQSDSAGDAKMPSNFEGSSFDGTESFFAVYTQTQVVLNGVRLTINGNISQQVSDLAAQIETARRNFIHTNDVTSAIQDVMRISSTFRQLSLIHI